MNTADMVILGCALVTFIPRLIPSIFVGQINFSKKLSEIIDEFHKHVEESLEEQIVDDLWDGMDI